MKLNYSTRFAQTLVLFLLLGLSSFAQDNDKLLREELGYLSNEQRSLLLDQKQLQEDTRKVFKDNLSSDQLALLSNRNISVDQRTALLKQSLSPDQRDLISSNRNLIRAKKLRFRRSLTKKQRMKLRRYLKQRPLSDRKRLARRLRRLIQNNMD